MSFPDFLIDILVIHGIGVKVLKSEKKDIFTALAKFNLHHIIYFLFIFILVHEIIQQ